MLMIILIYLIQLNIYLKNVSTQPDPTSYLNFDIQFEHYAMNRANITHMPYYMRRKEFNDEETKEHYAFQLYHVNQINRVKILPDHTSLIYQQMGEDMYDDSENFTQTLKIGEEGETEVFYFVKYQNRGNIENIAYSEKHTLFPQKSVVRLEQSIMQKATDGSTITIYQYRIQLYKLTR
uniref:Uncharacterized protein n=1 Tax=Meloidogyne hapla TaxID=6305 RepID=A0A1I8B3J2_MELHA